MERRRFLSNDELPDNIWEVLEQVFKDIVYNEFKGLGFIEAELSDLDELDDNYLSFPFDMFNLGQNADRFFDDNTVDNYANIRDYAMRRILPKLIPTIKHPLLEQNFPNYIFFVKSADLEFIIFENTDIIRYHLRMKVMMRVEDISD